MGNACKSMKVKNLKCIEWMKPCRVWIILNALLWGQECASHIGSLMKIKILNQLYTIHALNLGPISGLGNHTISNAQATCFNKKGKNSVLMGCIIYMKRWRWQFSDGKRCWKLCFKDHGILTWRYNFYMKFWNGRCNICKEWPPANKVTRPPYAVFIITFTIFVSHGQTECIFDWKLSRAELIN